MFNYLDLGIGYLVICLIFFIDTFFSIILVFSEGLLIKPITLLILSFFNKGNIKLELPEANEKLKRNDNKITDFNFMLLS